MIKFPFAVGTATALTLGSAAMVLPAPALAQAASWQQASTQRADQQHSGVAQGGTSFAKLAFLADQAPLVVIAEVRKTTTLKPERAGPVAAGKARLYVEAETVSLLSGDTPLGEKLIYLADVDLDARGRVPKLRRRRMVLFARPVPGRPSELQLVAPDAQLPLEQAGEARLRALLAQLVDPEAPPRITGVGDALQTPGNLAGESETQIFLKTENGDPALITVRRRPGAQPVWGLSTGELVDANARPPGRDTLGWYRLACFLPPSLPATAHLTADARLREAAEADYALVLRDLGTCERPR